MRVRLALAAIVAICVAACSHAGMRHTSGSRLLFSGLAGEPDTLNPMLSNEADELNFSHLYMSYLIENDDRGNAVGEIAERVPTPANGGVSRDRRTVTYRLRTNVRWQDGVPLTARDVVFSYRAIVDPRNNVATRVGYREVESIEAPDARTVVVRLRRPFSPFVQYFFGPQGVGRDHARASLARRNGSKPRRLQSTSGRIGPLRGRPMGARRQRRNEG